MREIYLTDIEQKQTQLVDTNAESIKSFLADNHVQPIDDDLPAEQKEFFKSLDDWILIQGFRNGREEFARAIKALDDNEFVELYSRLLDLRQDETDDPEDGQPVRDSNDGGDDIGEESVNAAYVDHILSLAHARNWTAAWAKELFAEHSSMFSLTTAVIDGKDYVVDTRQVGAPEMETASSQDGTNFTACQQRCRGEYCAMACFHVGARSGY